MGKISPGMKMMLLNRATERQPRSEYTGNGNERRMIGYDRPENRDGRNGDHRGGGHNPGHDGSEMRRYAEYGNYPESRYIPMGGWHEPPMDRYPMGSYPMDNYPEHDRPENRRRRSRRTGRFIKGAYNGMDDDDEEEDYRPKSHYGNAYGDIYAEGTIYAPGAMNKPMHGQHQEYGPVTESKARKWVRGMTNGEKYPFEHSEQQRKTLCPECESWEFYVAMNAMYSDHCETAKKIGQDKPEFYAMLAKDFLMDDDAGPNKLSKYMETIPKK